EPELAREVEPRRLVVRRQRDRTVEQVHGRRRVVACERTLSGCAEDLRRALSQLDAVLVERSELLPVADGLLEVLADDLVDVAGLAGPRVRRPLGIALVEPCTQLLRYACVRRVADEHVPEAVRVLASWTRKQQVLPRQAEEARVDGGLLLLDEQLAQ